jgi:hypothetical protein
VKICSVIFNAQCNAHTKSENPAFETGSHGRDRRAAWCVEHEGWRTMLPADPGERADVSAGSGEL